MKNKIKRSITLPELQSNLQSYAKRAVNLAKKCCDEMEENFILDQGYGDRNMTLFRFKNKKKFIKVVPTAFTPEVCKLLDYIPSSSAEAGIVNQHNEEIRRILSEPKQSYNSIIQKQQQLKQSKRRQMLKAQQYKKGYDNQLRQYNQHLSFGYLSHYQANNWFIIKDNSKDYRTILPKSPSTQVKIARNNKNFNKYRFSKPKYFTPKK